MLFRPTAALHDPAGLLSTCQCVCSHRGTLDGGWDTRVSDEGQSLSVQRSRHLDPERFSHTNTEAAQ